MAAINKAIVTLWVLAVAGMVHSQQRKQQFRAVHPQYRGVQCGCGGTDPCCAGNTCQKDTDSTWKCLTQCSKAGEMCQPAAHEEFDECCSGSRCEFSDSKLMFACTAAPTEAPCKEENAVCSVDKECCEGLECQNRRCKPPQQCISEGSACDMYNDKACCEGLSCHGTIFSNYRTTCNRQCAGYGTYCGKNTRCCSNYCNYFTGTCQGF